MTKEQMGNAFIENCKSMARGDSADEEEEKKEESPKEETSTAENKLKEIKEILER